MNYPSMAQDLVDTTDALQIDKATFIGHSMGGKAVMALTALAPDRIDKLVAIDIAPVDYVHAVMMRFSRPSTQSVNRTHKLASKQQQ